MDTGVEGGRLIPLQVLGAGSGAIKGLTSFPLNVWNLYDSWRRMDENKRYWSDYERNTGFSPRYPFRSGSHNDYTRAALSFVAGAGQSFASAYSSYDRYNGGNSYSSSRDFDPYSNGYY